MLRGPRTRTMIAAVALCLLASATAADAEIEGGSALPAPKSYGQYLVERTLTKHPELIALDLRPRPPDAPRVVVAEKRVEVEVPLQDTSGQTIGGMRAVYANADGGDEAHFLSRAQALSGEMQRQIPTQARLAQAVRPADGLDIGGTQSLPTTKQVVSGRSLAENEQEGYAEAVKNVAGVAPANSKGSANDSIYIRGIKLNLFSNYRINGGLPVAGVITMPNEDKARLETLKGANALQFGVASPAGIINMITKRAGENDVTSVSAAASSFGQYGGAFDVGRRYGDEGQLGVRINASATQLDNGVHSLGGDGEFASAGVDYRFDRLTLQGDFEYYRKHVPEQAGISLLDPVNGVV